MRLSLRLKEKRMSEPKDISEDLQTLIEWLTEAEEDYRMRADRAYAALDDAHAPGSSDKAHSEPHRLLGMANGIKLARARLIATLIVANESDGESNE